MHITELISKDGVKTATVIIDYEEARDMSNGLY